MNIFFISLKHFFSDLPIMFGMQQSAASFVGDHPDALILEKLRLRQHSMGCGATGTAIYHGDSERLNIGARFLAIDGSILSEDGISFLASDGMSLSFSITSPSLDVSRAEVFWQGFGDLGSDGGNTEQGAAG